MFSHCEEFVALQFAFVLSDIVARTVASLFAAMLCLTFLTAAHLFYSSRAARRCDGGYAGGGGSRGDGNLDTRGHGA